MNASPTLPTGGTEGADIGAAISLPVERLKEFQKSLENQADPFGMVAPGFCASGPTQFSVAAMPRREPRAMPQTPCPLVQPFPSAVPKPTSKPPAISVGQLAVMAKP